jgi:hypothetical protein
VYHVILEGVDVMYDMTNDSVVKVLGAELGGTGGRVLLSGEDKQKLPDT